MKLICGCVAALSFMSGSSALAQGTRPATAAQVVDEAFEALGGKARILAVKTLTIEGYGRNPNIGQAMTPEAEPLYWMLPDYKRSIDLERGRMELSLTRRPAFPAVFDNARQVQRLDGDVAYNLGAGAGGRGGGAPQAPARLGADVARDRRVDMLQHPLVLLRAAVEPGAAIGNLRQTATRSTVEITTVAGDRLTLAVDALKRPVSITTTVYHSNLGDTSRVTTFDAYENLDGIRLPKRMVTTLDRWVEFDIGVMKNTLDADLADLAAPPATRAAAPPGLAPQNVVVTPLAKGLWFLTGGGIPSLVVEFADHVAIVEAGSEARFRAVLAKARELVPGKPVTQLVLTHHHFDHTGGLRTAVAEGLTVVAHGVNEAWFREAVMRRHTVVPDALARAPQPLKLVVVGDSHTFEDAAMSMQLLHLAGSTHGDGLLAIYFPRERIYAEADVWNPGAQIQPHLGSLADDIARRKLLIERVVPLHGQQVQPYSELEKTIAEWRGRRATTTVGLPPAPGN